MVTEAEEEEAGGHISTHTRSLSRSNVMQAAHKLSGSHGKRRSSSRSQSDVHTAVATMVARSLQILPRPEVRHPPATTRSVISTNTPYQHSPHHSTVNAITLRACTSQTAIDGGAGA